MPFLLGRLSPAGRRTTGAVLVGSLVLLLGTGTAVTASAEGPATTAPGPAEVGQDLPAAVGLDVPRATLPVEPEAAEVPDTVTGTVLRAYAEVGAVGQDGHEHEHPGIAAAEAGEQPGLLTWISTDDGLAVKVPTDQLEDVADGAAVQARLGDVQEADGDDPQGDEQSGHEVLGHEVLGAETLDSTESPSDGGPEVLAASAPHQVTVVMVAPAGQTKDSATLTQVVSAVKNGASPFWSQQTGGATSVDVVATRDWISTTASCGSPFALWDEVAKRVGWTSGAGKHLLLYVSSQGTPSGCYSGLGTVGAGPASGGMAYVRSTNTSIVAHELGHNMGLGHSNGLLCAGTSDGAYSSGWSNGCTSPGYRDWYDVMGTSWSNLGSLNAPHAVAMGALVNGSITDVTEPTRATLAPMSGLTGLRALTLVDGTSTYSVEFRPASGQDTWLSSNDRGLAPGVTVRRTDPLDSRGSLLLDGTPSSTVNTNDWNSPIPVGSTLRIASGKFLIKVEALGTSGAQVAVAVGGVWPATTTTSPPVDLASRSTFVPVAPTRVLDRTPTPQGTMHTLTLPGVPSGATAVALNITAAAPTARTYVSVCPGGTAIAACRASSNLNPPAGKDTAGLVTVKLGPGGTVNLYNNSGTTSLIADLQGWFVIAPDVGTRYTPTTPFRALSPTTVPGGTTHTFKLPGVPAAATAVALNVTAANPDSKTFVSVCPGGTPMALCKTSSALNPPARTNTANHVLVKLGPDGTVTVYNNSGSAALIADVQGWFIPEPATGARFSAVTPYRALERTAVVGGTALTLTLADVPAGATAVTLSVTAAGPTTHTFVSACPGGTPLSTCKTSSSLNPPALTDTANLVTVKLGVGGTVRLYNNSGTAGIIADVQGWYVVD